MGCTCNVLVICLFLVLWLLVHGEDSPEIVILVTDTRAINKISVKESQTTVTRLSIPDLIKPTAIDVDVRHGHIYWTDAAAENIRRADIDGKNDVTLADLNSTSNLHGLAIDSNTRQIFYTDLGNHLIARIDMRTFTSTLIVNTDLDRPKGIVADTIHRKLYWVDFGNRARLETCNYHGGDRRRFDIVALLLPMAITIDAQAGRLYWVDGLGEIESVGVDGSGRQKVKTYSSLVPFYDLAYFNGFLYYTKVNTRDVYALPAENGQTVLDSTFTSGLFKNPVGIHVFSINFNGTVSCPNGRYGDNCEACGRCVDGQICEKSTGACFGGCSPGYKQNRCKQVCDPGTYGKNCGFICSKCKRGTSCNAVSGQCLDGCQPGWRGDTCDTACPPKTYGSCIPCGMCARGVSCNILSGVCPNGCHPGWKGDRCYTACRPNTFGPQCKPCGHCSGDISCDRESGGCPAGCEDNWTGTRCNIRNITDESATTEKQHALSAVSIIAIAVGIVLAVVAITIIAAVCAVKRQRQRTSETRQSTDYMYVPNSANKDYLVPINGQSSNGSGFPEEEQPRSLREDEFSSTPYYTRIRY